ncbi:hypothetical protein [Zavarzinia aquatilis]|uniref:Uncharacterized protein n=1 Tax=Zavarzinia aquatilis TaxID=2211142 RepID=A0A317EED8_9PROT|nr:hypothetical protein [Zavarzinia aquatilis]PWR24982.1 hypothetical protein DKG74_04225 [Zavarzinia aquatilis]
MALTDIDIANAALVKLGNPHLTAWEEASKAGRLIRGAYARCRNAELQRARWCFSLGRAMLPALAEAPAFGFARAFRLPIDYLSLVQIGLDDVGYLAVGPEYRQGDPATWSIEGRDLLTDLPAPLPLRYIRRIEDPTLFHPLFDEVLAIAIALEICEALTSSTDKRESLHQDYKLARRDAARIDAIQKHPAYPPDGPWLMSRVMA